MQEHLFIENEYYRLNSEFLSKYPDIPESTVLSWRQHASLPQENTIIEEILANIVQCMPEHEKYTCISFDSTDLDHPTHTTIYAFVAKGILTSWSYCIYYKYFSTFTHADVIMMLKKAIQIARRCGLYVRSVVCDQHSTHVYIENNFCCFDESTNTYILKEEEATWIYDIFHLMNNIRNRFLLDQIDPANIHVSDLEHVIDKSELELRQEFKFRKYTFTGYDCEKFFKTVFSHDIVHHLTWYSEQNSDETVAHTVKFLSTMANFIDDFSLVTFFALFKRGEVQKFDQYISYLKSIDTNEEIVCVRGFVLTLCGLKTLTSAVFDTYPEKVIDLSHLTTDYLEHFFAYFKAVTKSSALSIPEVEILFGRIWRFFQINNGTKTYDINYCPRHISKELHFYLINEI